MEHNFERRTTIDISSRFRRTNFGNCFLLVILNYFTKWPQIIAVPNQEAKIVASALIDEWIYRFEVPLKFTTTKEKK